ncbi:hypothetical protein Q7P37_009445 [Cladosporium fusiforme]
MDEHDNRFPLGHSLLIWTTLLLLYSSSLVIIRTWAKWQHQWSWSDWIFVAGYLAALVQCTTIYVAIEKYGLGSGVQDRETNKDEEWMESLYASQILYIVSMGLSRCSTAFFLRSLSRAKKHEVVGSGIAGVAVLWAIASIFANALRGDLSAPWRDTKTLHTRWLIIEIVGLAVEVLLFMFAFAMIYNLQTRLHRRVKLLLIFAARLVLIPIIIVRLARLHPKSEHQTINDVVMANILAQLAMHWALISECLTCLKPFLQTWHDGAAPESEQSQYWGALSNMMSNSSAMGNSGNNRSSKAYTSAKDNGDLKLRADLPGFSTKIASERKRTYPSDAEDDIELLPSSGIRVTTTLTTS